MDQLNGMRAFAAVAGAGSFAEAARKLRLSPSAVTRYVAQLEDRLGLTLLSRTTRSVRLTERGRIYLESCQQILDDVADAERRARGESAAPRGELTVAAPVLFGRLHVLPVVTGLLAAHSGLRVRMVLSDRNVQLVEEGVDAAVRIGALSDSSLVAVKLGEVGRVLVASPAYLAERGAPATPAELARHEIVAFEGLGATDEWRFGVGGGASVRVEPRLVLNGADAALAAAEAGAGVTRVLSYQAAAGLRAGRLAPVLEAFAEPPVPVSAVYPPRRVASPNVAVFVAALRERFRRDPLPAP